MRTFCLNLAEDIESNALIIDSDIYDESKKIWIRNTLFYSKPSPDNDSMKGF